jgi:hypothetical protein
LNNEKQLLICFYDDLIGRNVRPDIQKLSSVSLSGLGAECVKTPLTPQVQIESAVPEEQLSSDSGEISDDNLRKEDQGSDAELQKMRKRLDSTLAYYADNPMEESPKTKGKLLGRIKSLQKSSSKQSSATSLDTQYFGDFTFKNVDVLGDVSRDLKNKELAASSSKPPGSPASLTASAQTSEQHLEAAASVRGSFIKLEDKQNSITSTGSSSHSARLPKKFSSLSAMDHGSDINFSNDRMERDTSSKLANFLWGSKKKTMSPKNMSVSSLPKQD